MFGKLKEKLKSWVKKISENEEEIETPKKEIIEQSDFVTKEENKKLKKEGKKKEKISKKETKKPTEKKEKIIESKIEKEELIEEKKPVEKKSFFSKLISSKRTITKEDFLNYSEDLEMILLENNVALEVSEKIIEKLKEKIVGNELSKKEIEETIKETLKKIIEEVLIEPFDLIEEIKNKKTLYVILFCGINGTGKTTTIAKIANMLKEKKISSVLAAGDTFRAASIEQLKKHGENLGIKVIAHEYGADPAAVGFDAIKYAEKNNIKVVLIDTAGRIHTATNLLKEMEKIKRVCKPDRTIFLGESITGNDSVDQVKAFDENIGLDGIILSKADIDEKGGTALSVGYVTKKPIIYLGTGQEYKDLEKFDKKKFIDKLELD